MISTHAARISSAAASPLETYFRQINETPLLTAEQERQLAYRIEDGDAEAREHLVRANLRLVVNIARGYQNKGLDLHDLIAEGNLGLLRAAEAFDASMETRFSTYAAYWVKQSIRRALINSSRTIRLPAYMQQLLTEWRKATARLHEELGRAPTEDEVSAYLELTPRKLRLVKKAIRIHNATPAAEEEGATLDDLVADGRSPAPGAGLAHADEMRQVLQFVDELEDREKAVLRLRFGLDGEEPKTLKEIGERLGLTRERVRQIEQHALSTLQERLLEES
jgi:RNA polymerase primary sigma factor